MANQVTIEPYQNNVIIEAYRYQNSVVIETIDIMTVYYFLSPTQVMPVHNEVAP